jgi:hypothetical protein
MIESPWRVAMVEAEREGLATPVALEEVLSIVPTWQM